MIITNKLVQHIIGNYPLMAHEFRHLLHARKGYKVSYKDDRNPADDRNQSLLLDTVPKVPLRS